MAEVERAHGVDHEPSPPERPDLPGGDEVVGAEVLALAADVGAICLAVSGRVARLGKLPAEVAALVPLVQSQPRLRQLLEGQLGPTVTSLGGRWPTPPPKQWPRIPSAWWSTPPNVRWWSPRPWPGLAWRELIASAPFRQLG